MAHVQSTPQAEPRDSCDAETARLLTAVEAIAGTLTAGADQSDADGRLVDDTVAALRSQGFWRMRLCTELGGHELPIVSQMKVLAALAAVDTSSAWCTMVVSSSLGVLGATMPEGAVARIFAEEVPTSSIVASAAGIARTADQGYVLDGTWQVASAIHHADWIHATAYVDGDPSRPLALAIPAADVQLLDSWHAVGLNGTGSDDFSLSEYFLDAALTGDEERPNRQLRGTRRYDLVGLENVEIYEHLAFAIGVGRRALSELRDALAHPVPGRHTADREVVQSELARAMITLQAIETTALALYAKVDAAALGDPDALLGVDPQFPRALAAWATETALEITQLTFRRSGMVALRRPNIIEKLLRDMSVAATHVLVDDRAFAAYADRVVQTSSLAVHPGGPFGGN